MARWEVEYWPSRPAGERWLIPFGRYYATYAEALAALGPNPDRRVRMSEVLAALERSA